MQNSYCKSPHVDYREYTEVSPLMPKYPSEKEKKAEDNPHWLSNFINKNLVSNQSGRVKMNLDVRGREELDSEDSSDEDSSEKESIRSGQEGSESSHDEFNQEMQNTVGNANKRNFSNSATIRNIHNNSYIHYLEEFEKANNNGNVNSNKLGNIIETKNVKSPIGIGIGIDKPNNTNSNIIPITNITPDGSKYQIHSTILRNNSNYQTERKQQYNQYNQYNSNNYNEAVNSGKSSFTPWRTGNNNNTSNYMPSNPYLSVNRSKRRYTVARKNVTDKIKSEEVEMEDHTEEEDYTESEGNEENNYNNVGYSIPQYNQPSLPVHIPQSPSFHLSHLTHLDHLNYPSHLSHLSHLNSSPNFYYENYGSRFLSNVANKSNPANFALGMGLGGSIPQIPPHLNHNLSSNKSHFKHFNYNYNYNYDHIPRELLANDEDSNMFIPTRKIKHIIKKEKPKKKQRKVIKEESEEMEEAEEIDGVIADPDDEEFNPSLGFGPGVRHKNKETRRRYRNTKGRRKRSLKEIDVEINIKEGEAEKIRKGSVEEVAQKKRGRKKKIQEINPNIITQETQDENNQDNQIKKGGKGTGKKRGKYKKRQKYLMNNYPHNLLEDDAKGVSILSEVFTKSQEGNLNNLTKLPDLNIDMLKSGKANIINNLLSNRNQITPCNFEQGESEFLLRRKHKLDEDNNLINTENKVDVLGRIRLRRNKVRRAKITNENRIQMELFERIADVKENDIQHLINPVNESADINTSCNYFNPKLKNDYLQYLIHGKSNEKSLSFGRDPSALLTDLCQSYNRERQLAEKCSTGGLLLNSVNTTNNILKSVSDIEHAVSCLPVLKIPDDCKYSAVRDKKRRNNDHDRKYECKICTACFDSRQGLGGHVSRIHQGQSENYNKKKAVRMRRQQERERLREIKREICKRHKKNFDELMADPTGEGKRIVKNIILEHNQEYVRLKREMKKMKKLIDINSDLNKDSYMSVSKEN